MNKDKKESEMWLKNMELETQIRKLEREQKELQERVKYLECSKHVWIFESKVIDLWSYGKLFYCFRCNNCGKKIRLVASELTKTMRLQLEIIGILEKETKKKK